MNIFLFAAIGMIAGMTIAAVRAVKGPTFYDRLLAVNTLGTKTTVLLALSGYLFERPDFTDIALLYAIMNQIATVGLLKLIEKRSLA